MGERLLYLRHQFRNSLLLLQNRLHKLFRREVLEVLPGAGVFDVKIDGDKVLVLVVFQNVLGFDLPSLAVRLALVPPLQARGEFLKLHGLGLGVVLPAFGQGLLVVPDVLGGTGAIEKEEIRRDRGVRSEDAVGEPEKVWVEVVPFG